jgi:hypothetical protein
VRVSRFRGTRAPKYVRVRDRAGNYSSWRSVRVSQHRGRAVAGVPISTVCRWTKCSSRPPRTHRARLVVVSYSDLAGRRYHTVIRLSDPGNGQRRDVDTSRWEAITQDGTEVGEGEAPLPQWRVTFYGTLTDEQETRLRANAMQLLSSHAVGTSGSLDEPPKPSAWSYSVFTSAQSRGEAIERVQSALSDGTFGKWNAELWTSAPFDLPREETS